MEKIQNRFYSAIRSARRKGIDVSGGFSIVFSFLWLAVEKGRENELDFSFLSDCFPCKALMRLEINEEGNQTIYRLKF